jgi:HPr kinase/phosphorylase
MYRVEEFYKQHQLPLKLKLIGGEKGLARPIKVSDVMAPGLILTGFLKSHSFQRMLVFGKSELHFLRTLSAKERYKRLDAIFSPNTPCICIAEEYKPLQEMLKLCEKKSLPLFQSSLRQVNLLTKLNTLLIRELAPSILYHGTLVEVFGVGVLIQGNSSVGKSETALDLIERGHRLIVDDVVKIYKFEGGKLEGFPSELTKNLMEIRGIGIIDVSLLYGAGAVYGNESKSIDIIVHLETWNDQHTYDRVGLEEKSSDILQTPVPFYLLPVKPGRDVALLLETIALNHRVKRMGLNAAEEFNKKLHLHIASKKKSRKKGGKVV